MKNTINGIRFAAVAIAAVLFVTTFASAASANQHVLLGSSFATGDEAAAEANLMIANANAAGCKAISVGGYGLADLEAGKEIGIPVLMDCPPGVDLLPNGKASNRGGPGIPNLPNPNRPKSKRVNGVTYYEVDFSKGQTGKSVCNSIGKQPARFSRDLRVCRAFNPSARTFSLNSGDRATTFCSGTEQGICKFASNSCVVCPSCTNGVRLDQNGGRLYDKMYVSCK